MTEHMDAKTARKAMAKRSGQQPETLIKKQVKAYLQVRGWFVHPNLQGLGCYPGIPDFTAYKGGRVVGIEIKTAKGVQSEHQLRYEADVRAQQCEYRVVRSLDDAIAMDREMEGA